MSNTDFLQRENFARSNEWISASNEQRVKSYASKTSTFQLLIPSEKEETQIKHKEYKSFYQLC